MASDTSMSRSSQTRAPHRGGSGRAAGVAAGMGLVAALGIGAASAQAPAPEAQRALESRRNELDTAEKRAKALEQDVRDIADTREKLNARLVETAALIQKSEARLNAIEARLGELDAQEKLLQGSLNQRHDQIAKLLSALLRMGRNPPPVMITRREDALEMVRSAMLLASAFPELREQALSLAGKLNELVRVKTDIRTEGDRLKIETTRLSDARTRLAGLMESKKQSLAERQAELEDVRKTAASISKSVGELSELIAQLDKAVKEKTGLGAYEESIKREAAEGKQQTASATTTVAAAPPVSEPARTSVAEAPKTEPPKAEVAKAEPAAPPAADGAAPGTTDTADKPASDKAADKEHKDPKETKVAALTPPPPKPVIELAPTITGAVPGNLGRIQPAIPFQHAKHKLPLPAQGRRVLSFSEKTQYGGASKGMVLETRQGAQITSPCDGWVVYAGEFRSYGQLLIINAGGGYHILLAGLSQISAQPGQFVLAAEPIGTMSGAPTAAAGKAQGSSAPVLYIEFRKDGRPVDPDPWWVDNRPEGQQKVQG